MGKHFILLLFVAALGQGAEVGLDQKAVHRDYNDGNFEKVVHSLEGFMALHSSYSREDSIFIAKHLAVVYSANPNTREKGKYYMYRLLTMLPSAKLVDMFVSDEIDRIFDKVREEYVARQSSFGVDTTKIFVPNHAPSGSRGKEFSNANPPPEASNKSHTGLWVAGGATLVAVGLTTAYFITQASGSTVTDHVYRVPKN